MGKIDDLLNLWKKDSIIDDTNISREILEIPKLHSKYLNILSNSKIQVRSLEIELNKLRKLKYAYYSGKMSDDELDAVGWKPFAFILKSDISIYMEGDQDLNDMLSRKAIQEEVIDICTSVMKELHNRTWSLKNYIDYQRFLHGGNLS